MTTKRPDRTPPPPPEAGAGASLLPATLAPGQSLSREDLALAGEQLFGRWGWQTRLAEALEVDGSTVRRWVSGAVAVPQPAKVAIRLMLAARGASALLVQGGEAPARPLPSRPRSTRLEDER